MSQRSFVVDEDELGNIFKSIAKGVGKAATGIAKGVASAAKWTAGAVSTVLDSTAFKIVFPVKFITDNPLAKKLGAKIPIVGQAIKAEADARAIMKKISSGKNVTNELVNAGKQAVAKANKLSAQAKKEIEKAAPGGAASLKAVAQTVNKKSKNAGVLTQAAKAVSSVSKGVASAAKPKPKPAVKAAVKKATSKPATMALAAPVPMPAPAGVAPVIHVTVQPLPPRAAVATQRERPKIDIDDLTSKIEARLGPKFNAVTETLKQISLQNQATTEHKKIVEKDDFQRKVIDSLKRISKKTGS